MTGLDVAITASAARTALGEDVHRTWQALRAGRSALAPVEGFDASGFGSPRAAQIWREPEAVEDDPVLRILGTHGRLLDALVTTAHADGAVGAVEREQVGLYVALGMVDAPVEDLAPAVLASRGADGHVALETLFARGFRAVHPLWPLSMLGNVAVGQVAMDLDIRGDNVVLASDAVAGVRVLLEGARALQEGVVDAALVGGVSERISPASLTRLQLRGLLDAGVEPGEGGAAFVLRTGAEGTVLGRLRGGATTFGRAAVGSGPCGAAVRRAIESALAEARLEGGAIDVVFDPTAAAPTLGGDLDAILASAGCAAAARIRSRAALGHCVAGAALVDVAVALRLLQAGEVPPPPVGAGTLRPVGERARRALVLAVGSQGGAGALVLEVAA